MTDWRSVMKKFFLFGIFLVILLISLQKAQGLECYKCKSSASWDDCNANRKKITCKSGTTECCNAVYTAEVSGTKCTIREKFCKGDPQPVGDDKCSGKAISIWSAARSCCSGNLCNAGAHNLGNHALIIIVSALMLLLFY